MTWPWNAVFVISIGVAVNAVMFAAGCAQASPRITRFPAIRHDLSMVELPLRQVDQVCRWPNITTDAGLPYPVWYWPNTMPALHGERPSPPPERVLIRGCYDPKSNTIYVDEMGGPELLRHELCHASGRAREDCGGLD